MPVVTAIRSQKNQKRVNIYLGGKFGFGLDLENFVKLNLKVEQELSEKQIAEIIKKAEFQKTLNKLLRFATLRPRSEKEISNWLRKYKVHESLYKKLFSRLKRLDLVDDKKFATWWVNQRNQFRPRSKRELNQELRIKGIPKEIISDVLEKIKIDEVVIAKNMLKKNMCKWKKLDKYKTRQKKSAYLARKGFGWEIIKKVC